MIKKLSLPSFLEPTPPRLVVTPQITYKLVDLIKVSAPTLLTHEFVRKHSDELRTALFEFQVEQGTRKWTIIKRFEDFLELRSNTPYRLLPKMPFPVQSAQNLEDSILSSLLAFLGLFLNELMRSESALDEGEIKKFVGIPISRKQKQLKIYYQCTMLKRAGGRHDESGFKKFLNFFTSWEERFFTISDESVYLTEYEGSEDLLDSLLFTTTFSFLYGQASTGYPYGIILNSSHRVLHIDAQDVFTFAFFIHFLAKASSYNLNMAPNRYGSFARIHPACDGKYYLDGQDYFSDLYEALVAAEKEIFITGWMISPFFLLKRPDEKEESRLDQVLATVAKAGVKINIVLYNGPKVALNIDSQFTQDYLSSLSPNIRILMHPNYVLIPFLWSHHEKMVVIDQKIAFLGGLDLGYGRLDSKMHFLSDEQSELWPGVDYCNYRVTDILEPREYRKCSINRATVPRMPWHDIGVRLIGGAVQDLCRHFIQYWNYVNFQLNMNDRELLMYVGLTEADIDARSKAEEIATKGTLLKRNRTGVRLSTTEDANNFDLDQLLGQQEEQQKQKQEEEKEEEKRRSQSSCFRVTEKEEWGGFRSSVFTVEKSDEKQREKEIEFYATHLQDVGKLEALLNKFNPKNLLLHRQGTSFEDVILSESYELSSSRMQRKRSQNHQILRSASMWSLGLQEANTEQSIHNAYLQLIDSARQFIYIQNQFFISVDNKVTDALRERILRAHHQKERFRVVIILPALPGFEGHPADENAAVFRVQIHLHLKNIKEMYRGLRSIPNIRQYLHFFSLRTHGVLNNQPVTEIIYVHSKMMIVDDRVALIGSANINDRSLMGCRDTELAVVIEDSQTREIKVAGGSRIVSEFAHELRKELYMEHFALNASEAQDYLNDDVWESMVEWSAKNHQIYRELFGCYPDNEMDTFQSMSKVAEDADPSRYHLLKDIIKGHAIPFQVGFLRRQDLSLHAGQKEYFLPEINFT